MRNSAPRPSAQPSGTVTFLFTDIEASTRLWQRYPDAMPAALARHHSILSGAIQKHGGYVFQLVGDAFCAAFHKPTDGLMAALQAQRDLSREPWKGIPGLRVRMGLHTGEAELASDGDYRGYLTLSRIQRLMSTAHGGQLLVSSAAEQLLGNQLPPELMLRFVGELHLKDFTDPEPAFQLVAPDLQFDFPALTGSERTPHNLPHQLTSLVGREQELAELTDLLERTRLLTLAGTGGVGKTRLCLQLANASLQFFPQGVWFVELAPLQNPELLPETIATALTVREEPGRSVLESVCDHLKKQRALVVLDNCEHLLEGCASIVDAILRAAPEVKVLATSREALGIGGELSYRVPSLSAPPAAQKTAALMKFDAVRLFVERAKAARPGHEFGDAEIEEVARICRQLDGIPLAIELAAVRVKSMSVAQIASLLGKRERFQLLTSGNRTAMSRHQTLRALIDWSYDLLSEAERSLLRRLSVFAGSWSLESAERVCSYDAERGDVPEAASPDLEILENLTRLIDKSLVVLVDTEDPPRYRMLEMIRQYAGEKLLEAGEASAMRDRHLDCCVELAEALEKRIYGQGQVVWLNVLESEHPNMRTAFDWALETDRSEVAYRFSWALLRYWEVRSRHTEGLDYTVRALNAPALDAGTGAQARALGSATALHFHLARFAEARVYCERAVSCSRAANDQLALAFALLYSALLSITDGDFEAGRIAVVEARALYPASPGDAADAQKVVCGTAFLLALMGDVLRSGGEVAEATALYAESIEMLREVGDRYSIAYPLRRRAHLLLLDDDWTTAAPLALEGLEANLEIGDTRGALMCIGVFAAIALCRNEHRRAARLAGCVSHLFSEISDCMLPLDQVDFDSFVSKLRSAASREGFTTAWDSGCSIGFDQAVSEVRGISASLPGTTGAADVRRGSGDDA